MLKDKFQINVSDWTKINIDSAKFILEQGKSYESYLVEASNKITNRAFSVLTVLIPIVSAVIALTVSEKVKPAVAKDYFISFLCLTIIATLFVMFELSQIVFPRLFMQLGRSPRELCIQPFLIVERKTDNSQLALVLNEIEDCQVKIDYNEKQNSQRTKKLENSLLHLGFLFISFCLLLITVLA